MEVIAELSAVVVFPVNDLKNAVPCAASYMLFDPKDEVMKNNVAYYKFHKKQWDLTEEDFLPRSVSHLKGYKDYDASSNTVILHCQLHCTSA